MGVISVLVGLLLPTLSAAVGEGRMTRAASQVRQDAHLIDLYATDWKSIYPVAAPRWFDAAFNWYDPVRSGGYLESVEAADPHGFRRAGFVGICMSGSMACDPLMARPGATLPVSQAPSAAVRTDQVQYPASKGMVLQYYLSFGRYEGNYWCCSYEKPRAPVAFADGSTSVSRWIDMIVEPHAPPENNVGHPVISTWNGCRGRDR